MKLLHIDSSALGEQSASRALTRRVTTQWAAKHPGTTVEYLDLATQAPAHLGADALGFRSPATANLSAAQQRENGVSEQLVSQFLAADVVVIGAPMYNFSVPSQLKAWIDRIAQPGRTFRYTAAGPEGLAKGKVVFIVSTRGGEYTAPGAAAMDHQETYLKTVLGFFGITDIRIVRAEGLAMGDEAKARALATAEAQLKAHSAAAANRQPVALAA